LATLEAVIDHYEKGGSHSAKQDELIRGFRLSSGDRADLLAFLRCLTDEAFLRDRRYSNPW
jgi:cytochrome c peroxidase